MASFLLVARVLSLDLIRNVFAGPKRSRVNSLPSGADSVLKSVALIVHAHYTDDLQNVLPSNLDEFGQVNVFVTSKKDLDVARARFPEIADRLFLVENKGRNFAPFLQGTSSIGASTFVLHLHTKRSPQMGRRGGEWGKKLASSLIQSPDRLKAIVQLLHNQPEITIFFPLIGPGNKPYVRGWGMNREHLKGLPADLASQLIRKSFYFPAGSMFLARQEHVSAVQNIFEQHFAVPEEPIASDGTTLHFLERLYGAWNLAQNSEQLVLGGVSGRLMRVSYGGAQSKTRGK